MPAPSLGGSVASSLAASARNDASSVAPSLVSARLDGGGVVDGFDIFASMAPPRRGSVPRSLSNPLDMFTGGTSGRSVASSISDVTGSFVSASRLGPSGRDVRGVQHGASESHGGSSAGNVSGEPLRGRSGMPIRDPDGNDMAAQFKMATITFDDDARPTPMVMEVMPAATRLSAVNDFDEAVFWCLRGAGQPDGGATFFPGLSAAQVAQQVFNSVQAAAVLRRSEYPFPVHMCCDVPALATQNQPAFAWYARARHFHSLSLGRRRSTRLCCARAPCRAGCRRPLL